MARLGRSQPFKPLVQAFVVPAAPPAGGQLIPVGVTGGADSAFHIGGGITGGVSYDIDERRKRRRRMAA